MRTIAQKILTVFLATFFVVSVAYAASSNLSGYGWAGQKDTAGNTVGVGWVDFTGVTMGDSASSGILSGKAWSPNIGWITFNSTELAGCPTAPCTAAADWSHPNTDGSINVKGWARACSVYASGCSGVLAGDAYRGTWDGWIALSNPSGTNWSGTNSVRFSPTTGDFSGYAWGDQVIGWLDFTGVKTTVPEVPVCSDGSAAPGGDTTKCDMCPGADNPGVQTSTTQCDVCPNDAGIQTSITQCSGGPGPGGQCHVGESCWCTEHPTDASCPGGTQGNLCPDGITPVKVGVACPPTSPADTPYCTNLPRYTQANPPVGVIRNTATGNCSCPVGKVMKLVNGRYDCAASHYEEH